MIHKILRRVRVNFRQTRSDRVATGQYRNYHERVQNLFKRVQSLPKGKFKK